MLKNLIFGICVIAFLSSNIFCQENSLLDKAVEAYRKKEYEKSAELYKKVIKEDHKKPIIFYDAACSLALSGEKDEAFKCLEIAVEKGYRNIKNLTKDEDLVKLKEDERWSKIVEKCQKNFDIHASKVNKELREELLSMMKEDQSIRKQYIASNFNKDFLPSMVEIDKKNTLRMKEIISKYGWPGITLVDNDGAKAAWVIAQHADHDVEFQKNCLDFIKKAFLADDVEPTDFAYLTDRVMIKEKNQQLYGTQLYSKDGKFSPLPIEDEANINERRRKIGLSPLEDYIKQAEESYAKRQKQEK
ncbi:MAG: DUF6624 domain-containing protein [Blastocatellia bacterium]|jgi:tetratricopeptide (TPR) repeat protein